MRLSLRHARLFTVIVCLIGTATPLRAQSASAPGQEKPAAAKPTGEKASFPFQIQLLETKIRFESNGVSRKEVHTIVKINDLLGARQFARLSFDYNRSFQQVELPLVRVSHANGGTSELLPSSISDAPNPAVEKFPAYHDVRVKSTRILGLQEGDTIEYRVITTTTKHPLAPNFWLEHTFDRSGQVSEESYELDLPAKPTLQLHINPERPATSVSSSGEADAKHTVYQWHLTAPKDPASADSSANSPDLALTTFSSWSDLAKQLDPYNKPSTGVAGPVEQKAKELAGQTNEGSQRLAAYYQFVAAEIKTVDIPLDALAFQSREPNDVLTSGYGTILDKFALLLRMYGGLHPVFLSDREDAPTELPIPSRLTKLIAATFIAPTTKASGEVCGDCREEYWMDIGMEVAPFGVVRPALRGKMGLLAGKLAGIWNTEGNSWHQIPDRLPFPAKQSVNVTAAISASGDLNVKVKYVMRGDNELLLRQAFHQSPKDKWNEVAGLLALSDGFRGTIINATASDPLSTKDPFTVEYEIAQSKFVDWSKTPVHIPVLLPQLGLPDPPANSSAGGAAGKIELGIPLEVQTLLSLRLPPGTVARPPFGTTVARDYVTFRSKYSATQNVFTAARSLDFLKRELPGSQSADYNAFVHAVQNDQAQSLTLEKKSPAPAKSVPAK